MRASSPAYITEAYAKTYPGETTNVCPMIETLHHPAAINGDRTIATAPAHTARIWYIGPVKNSTMNVKTKRTA